MDSRSRAFAARIAIRVAKPDSRGVYSNPSYQPSSTQRQPEDSFEKTGAALSGRAMASVVGGLETPLPRALRPHSDDEGEDEFDPLDIFHSAFVRALSPHLFHPFSACRLRTLGPGVAKLCLISER